MGRSEFQMHPQSGHADGTPIAVIAWIVDVLVIDSEIQTSPGVDGVEGFLDGFAPVIQSTVAENESQPAIREVGLVVSADSVRDEGRSQAIEAAMPACSLGIDAELQSAVGLGVGERLMLAFVPSPSAKGPDVAGKFLLEVDTEAVFDRPLLASTG